jgi:hypothetical protein
MTFDLPEETRATFGSQIIYLTTQRSDTPFLSFTMG